MFDHQQSTPRPKKSARRIWRLAVAATLCVASSATVGVASIPQQQALAAAGTPGVPGTSSTVFTEDFENQGDPNLPIPKNITAYTGAAGTTYTASPFWSSAEKCNGFILTRQSKPEIVPGAGIPSTLCGGVWQVWDPLKILSQKLSTKFGKAGDKFTVASYTAGEGVAPGDYVQAKSSPIALPAGGAFLTAAVDSAAYNCQATGPEYFLYLTDASGARKPVNSTALSPCTDPKATIDNSIDGDNAYIAKSVGTAPVLINSSSVSITLENHNVIGYGNDATFDNLQLIDVTPQLDKSFTSPIPFGSTSTATFTITNTYGPDGSGALTQLQAKPGWSFTDALPTGLTVVGTPTTGTGAQACGNFSAAGTTSGAVTVKGDLAAGQVSCTVMVQVKSTAPGTFTNLASDVIGNGVRKPADAPVTFIATPSMSMTKSGAVTDANANGMTDAGDKIAYSFVVTNTGNVPLNDVTVTDPKVGAVTCNPTTAPVGGSVVCTANALYTLTLADVNAGKVDNSATATGVDAFSGATVNAAANLTTPVAAAPKITLTKTAGTPVDVNKSGLVDAGDTVSYTFKVTNAGNVSMSNPTVVDPTLSSVTCPAVTLAPGESAECTGGPYTLTAADQTAGLHVNSATASAKTPAGADTPSTPATATTPVQVPKPSLSLKKTAGKPTDVNASGLVDVGDTIKFTFTVTNDGNVPVSSVSVNDPLVGAVTCAATTLAVGATTTCEAAKPYVITATDKQAGLVVNTATAAAKDPNGGPVTSPPSTTTTAVATPAPALTFTKKAGTPVDVNKSGLTDAGDTILYTFTVTNKGNVPMKSIVVTDNLIGAVTCAATSLAVGANTTCTANAPYTITAADAAAGAVLNTASASGKDPDGANVVSNTDTTATSVATPKPSLVFDKIADAPVDVNGSGITDAGDTIQYRFTVKNDGNVPISDVAVVDSLAGPVTCVLTTLAPGVSTTCTANAVYIVTTADEVAKTVVNTASAIGKNPNGGQVVSNTDNTSTAVVAPKASIVLEKKAGPAVDVNKSGLPDAGDTVQYTFTVTNNGNVPVKGVAVVDNIAGAVTCTTVDLAVGASTPCTAVKPYVITTANETAGVAINKASANAKDPNGATVLSNVATTTTTVAKPNPALAFTKTAGTPTDVNKSGTTDAGDTIVFTFTVTNNGNVTMTGITVTDPMVGAVTCAATTLAVGATTTCTAKPYTITAADQAAGAVKNSASASGLDPNGKKTPSNVATTTTPVVAPVTLLTLQKTAGQPVDVNKSGITDAGDTVAYTFTVSNLGNVTMTGVAITDAKIGPVVCASTTLAAGQSTTCTSSTPYTITASDLTSGSVVNTATATGTTPSGVKVPSKPATATTPVVTPAPAISLTKTAEPPVDANKSTLTDAGDTIQYNFTVTNIGNVPVSSVLVTDPLVGSVTCLTTTLAVKATTTCKADKVYTITGADQTAGVVHNTASAAGKDPDNKPVTSNSGQTDTPVQVPSPSVLLTKTAGVPTDVNKSGLVDAGDTIKYTFTVTNNGNVPLTAVRVDDPLVGAVTCVKTALAVKETTACTATALYVIKATDVPKKVVVNTATAYGTSPAGASVPSNTASTTTPVATPTPLILLTKTAAPAVDVNKSGLPDAGDTIQYSFTVTNSGNVPVTALAVVDPLVGKVTCASTSLAVGATTKCNADAVYVITKADEKAGRIDNTATANALSPAGLKVNSNPATATSPVAVPAPSLLVEKKALPPVDVNKSGLVDAGDTIQYEFNVINNGNVPMTLIKVIDPLIGESTCASTLIAPGASTKCTADKPYVITKENQTAGAVVNSATASGVTPSGETLISKPSTTSTVVKTPVPSIWLVKSAAAPIDVNKSGLRDAGDTIQFSFTVTNTGTVPVTAIKVTDPLAGSVTCQGTDLAVGKSTNCTADKPYVITAANQAAGAVLNTATSAGVAPDGSAVKSNTATTSTPLAQPKASLQLDKFAAAPVDVNADGIPDAGDMIRFSFKVTNNGNVPLKDLRIDDPMVTNITCATTTLAPGAFTDCVASDYLIVDKDHTAGAVKNVAKSTGVDPAGVLVTSNNDDTVTPVIKPEPRISLTKEAIDSKGVVRTSAYSVGDPVSYRFTVFNHGNVAIQNLKINDAMVGTSKCETTTLAVGASTVCRSDNPHIVTAQDAQAGIVLNTATAAGTYAGGKPINSQPATAQITVIVPTQVIPSTGSSTTKVLAAGGALLVMAGGLGLIATMRRRPKHAA